MCITSLVNSNYGRATVHLAEQRPHKPKAAAGCWVQACRRPFPVCRSLPPVHPPHSSNKERLKGQKHSKTLMSFCGENSWVVFHRFTECSQKRAVVLKTSPTPAVQSYHRPQKNQHFSLQCQMDYYIFTYAAYIKIITTSTELTSLFNEKNPTFFCLPTKLSYYVSVIK